MHDLHQAQKIAQIIIKEAKKHKLKKISRVLIDAGGIKEHGEILCLKNLTYNLKIFLEKEFIVSSHAIKIVKANIDGWKIHEVQGEKN